MKCCQLHPHMTALGNEHINYITDYGYNGLWNGTELPISPYKLC